MASLLEEIASSRPKKKVPADVAALGMLLSALTSNADQGEEQESGLPPWAPQPGPQELFFDVDADETLFGGAAGGGKSSAIIALPSKYLGASGFRGLVLRRSTPQLAGLIDEAKDIYLRGRDGLFGPIAPAPKGRFREDKGWLIINDDRARVWFGHCHDRDDWDIYHGQAFDLICFDELVQFELEQYLEIKSRLRGSSHGIRRRVVATTNPPKPNEPGAAWVKERWAPWLDKACKVEDWEEVDDTGAVVCGYGLPDRWDGGREVPPAPSGMILYVAKVRGTDRFSTEPFAWNGVDASTRVFIRSLVTDNPALLKATPNYLATLRDNNPVRAAQLERGDWDVQYGEGTIFKRDWFEVVDERPAVATRVRAWDLAATEPTQKNPDPDWTRGIEVSLAADGYYYVEDLSSLRSNPGDVRHRVKSVAKSDGKEVKVVLPIDPGQAAKDQVVAYAQDLDGYQISYRKPIADKVTRASPAAAQANPHSTGGRYGRFRVVRGHWNEEFFRELEAFPTGAKDDIVDAFSDAHAELAAAGAPAPAPPAPRTRVWGDEGGF